MTLRRKAMLILSRKVGEEIIIGEDIHVTVVNVDRSRVFLGINAPKSIPIAREELVQKRRQDAMPAEDVQPSSGRPDDLSGNPC
jgi:carbon storage regulator